MADIIPLIDIGGVIREAEARGRREAVTAMSRWLAHHGRIDEALFVRTSNFVIPDWLEAGQ
jgi:hypothetical protein